MANLREDLIKLAVEHPEFRMHLVPVLRRYPGDSKVAKVFPTEQARAKYLKEHPGAVRSRHKVAPPKPKAVSIRETLTGLSGAANTLIKSAPEHLQKFVHDKEFRTKALKDAASTLVSTPGKIVQSAVISAKHEVKEYGEASKGVKAWMSGKAMSKEQKHAFKAVAMHIGIATAAGALGVGLGAGAAALGKGALGSVLTSTAKKIAASAVAKRLTKIPTYEEIAHIGHHLTDLMGKLAAEKKDLTQDEVLELLVAAAIAKEIESLSEDDLRAALNEAATPA